MANKVTVDSSKLERITVTLRVLTKEIRFLNMVGEFIRSRIYQYTKRGMSLGALRRIKGPRGRLPGDAKKLKRLSPLYIEYRKSLLKDETKRASRGLLGKRSRKSSKRRALKKFGEFFSPSRSNLTLTGQMLDALETDIDASQGTVTVEVADTPREDSDLTNRQVAIKVSEDGRPFMGLDRVGADRIRRMIISELRRRLKRR